MAAEVSNVVTVQPRPKTGGRSGLNLRLAGRIPAVVYGLKKDPASVSVDAREFGDVWHTGTQLVQIKSDGKDGAGAGAAELVLIKEVQLDALGQEVVHVDFARVDLNKKVTVPLALDLRGKPAGVAEGGRLDVSLAEIDVECLPLDIPREAFRIDVTGLTLNAVLHVRDVKLPAKLTAVTSGDAVICAVHEVKDTPEAGAEGAEAPEVIIKGKGETEEGAAAAAPAAKAAAKK